MKISQIHLRLSSLHHVFGLQNAADVIPLLGLENHPNWNYRGRGSSCYLFRSALLLSRRSCLSCEFVCSLLCFLLSVNHGRVFPRQKDRKADVISFSSLLQQLGRPMLFFSPLDDQKKSLKSHQQNLHEPKWPRKSVFPCSYRDCDCNLQLIPCRSRDCDCNRGINT